MKKLVIKTNSDNVYKAYLIVMQSMLKISSREIELLAELCLVQSEVKDDKFLYVVLSTESRKKIREKLNITEAIFNNLLSGLKKKGLVDVETGVNKNLIFNDTDYRMLFEFTLDE